MLAASACWWPLYRVPPANGLTHSFAGCSFAAIPPPPFAVRSFFSAHAAAPLCAPSRFAILTGQPASCAASSTSLRALTDKATRLLSGRGVSDEQVWCAAISGAAQRRAALAALATRTCLQRARCSTNCVSRPVVLQKTLSPPAVSFDSRLRHRRHRTLAHRLKDLGYTTGMAGLWHLGTPELSSAKKDLDRLRAISRELADKVAAGTARCAFARARCSGGTQTIRTGPPSE